MKEFRELVEVLGIPVVTGMSSIDAIESEHPYYAGRNGGTGNRAGNFAVQNSDVLLSVGSRQSFVQTGFQYESWAREAYTILNDIDENELKKPNLHVSLPVCADAKEFIEKLLAEASARGASAGHPLFQGEAWREQCRLWRKNIRWSQRSIIRHWKRAVPISMRFMESCRSLCRRMPGWWSVWEPPGWREARPSR